MSILVDGYNYIGRSRELRLDDPKARDTVIYLMGQYCARVKKSLTIVFDGNHFVHHVNRKRRYGRVTVIYTSPIYTADDAIKKMVRKQQPRQRKSMLVVTSDAEILDYVKGHGARIERSEDFERTIYKTLEAPQEIERVNVQLSETDVQEWLALFGPEASERKETKRAPGVKTAKRRSQQTAEHQEPQQAASKNSWKDRRKRPSSTFDESTGIDRENVKLSAREVDEWMRIFGVEEDEDE